MTKQQKISQYTEDFKFNKVVSEWMILLNQNKNKNICKEQSKELENLYSKFFNRIEANYVKTYNYFTFVDYIKYGCSYYTLPTNFEKCKNFDGKLVDIKEGCKLFDEVV